MGRVWQTQYLAHSRPAVVVSALVLPFQALASHFLFKNQNPSEPLLVANIKSNWEKCLRRK